MRRVIGQKQVWCSDVRLQEMDTLREIRAGNELVCGCSRAGVWIEDIFSKAFKGGVSGFSEFPGGGRKGSWVLPAAIDMI